MRRAIGVPLVIVGLAVVVLAIGSLATVDGGSGAAQVRQGAALAGAGRGDVDALVARLRSVPKDHQSWATLGLVYIEKAKATANPEFYPRAEKALRRSLALNTDDNFAAAAGMAALSNARHDFAGGRDWSRRGLKINPSNATLYATLSDAETQLGNYTEAWSATQRMVDLSPDTASLARVSYSWELRGDLDQARLLMQRALDDALTPAQKAFARYHLGNLALNSGDAPGALAQYEAGLVVDRSYVPLLEGRARALGAVGRPDDARRDLAEAVSRLPEPGYVMLYGELLESLGQTDEAAEQYALFRAEQRLFEANGVVVDVEAALFEADHGDAERAVTVAELGLRTRPFIDMQDAYAWALYRAGRYDDALSAMKQALALGTKNPLFEFHAGMIEFALGNTDAAGQHLAAALAINPDFHPLHAATASQTLAALAGR